MGNDRCPTERLDVIIMKHCKSMKNPQSLVRKSDFNTNLTIYSSFERSPDHF